MDGPVVVHPAGKYQLAADDLLVSINSVIATAQSQQIVDHKTIQFALDILEGNPIPSRPTYSGLPVLHYVQTEKINVVQRSSMGTASKIGGNVNVHQIWYDQHIESDTALLDVSQVVDVPWEITYTIDVLHKGADDFAALVMLFDAPASPTAPPGSGGPGASMDLRSSDAGRLPACDENQDGARKSTSTCYIIGAGGSIPRAFQAIENVNKILRGQDAIPVGKRCVRGRAAVQPQAQLAAIACSGRWLRRRSCGRR